jgi:phage baseplate assembly protein W
MAMHVDFPYRFDGRGRTAEVDDDPHIRDMIEQLLFTAPGERVNRPTFGSGVLELVFAPNGEALAAATRLSVEAALTEWLGDLIEVVEAAVTADDATLRLDVRYVVRRTGEERLASLER